jgi:hypothetical protein
MSAAIVLIEGLELLDDGRGGRLKLVDGLFSCACARRVRVSNSEALSIKAQS